jgi:hypothetical protein
MTVKSVRENWHCHDVITTGNLIQIGKLGTSLVERSVVDLEDSGGTFQKVSLELTFLLLLPPPQLLLLPCSVTVHPLSQNIRRTAFSVP